MKVTKFFAWGFAAVLLPMPVLSAETGEERILTDSSLASSIGLYVYTRENQDAEQQAQDDYECYRSAKSRSGFDPLNPQIRPQVAEAEIEGRAGKESVKDVAGGAAVGGVIGRIGHGDAGEGAAIGGFLGAIRAYKKNKAYKQRQKNIAEREIEMEIQIDRLNFKNAFSACLTARGYAVN